MPVVTDYTALLGGSYWNGIEVTGAPVIVTYSFPTSLPAYDAAIPGFTPATDASFSGFTAAEQTQAQAALGEWAAASGLIFIQVAPGQGDINFQNVDFSTTSGPSYAGAGGIAFYPFGGWNNLSYPNFTSDLDASGDVFMNSQFQAGDGTVNYGTLLHEIGHAIGLKHPTETVTDFAAEPAPVVHDQVLSADDPALTVMATVGDGSPGSGVHLKPLDQDAAAFLYGAAGTGGVYTTSASGSNSVSSWSWDFATQTLTQTALATNEDVRGSSVDDVIHGLAGDRLFALDGNDTLIGAGGGDALYGGSGTDLLVGGAGGNSFYINSLTTTVDDTLGSGDTAYTTVSFALPAHVTTLYLYGQGLTGTANDEGDSLFGDGTYATTLLGGAGADYIVAGNGDDIIRPGAGADLVYGGIGADRFIYRSVSEAPVGPNPTTIGDFTSGTDTIDLSRIKATGGGDLGFIGTGAFTGVAGQMRQDIGPSTSLIEGDINGDGTADFEILLYGTAAAQSTDFNVSTACFRAGTLVTTEAGEVAVEDLAEGARIVTLSGEYRPVRWIGHRRIDCARHPEPARVWPVRVRAHAFAPGQPRRDLFLSPDHAVFADGVLIPVKLLINGATILPEPVGAVTYFHIELPEHAVLLAEGLPAESYLDTGNRGSFANGGAALTLHPDFAAAKSWPADAAAPLALDATRVRPVWERIAARAAELGLAVARPAATGDAAVRLEAGGRLIRPLQIAAGRLLFAVPAGTINPRLLSRAASPADVRPWSADPRRLGICVGGMLWHDAAGPRELPLDHPGLLGGWWELEQAGPVARRWTDGAATLPAPAGRGLLEVRLAGCLDAYPVDGDAGADAGTTRAA